MATLYDTECEIEAARIVYACDEQEAMRRLFCATRSEKQALASVVAEVKLRKLNAGVPHAQPDWTAAQEADRVRRMLHDQNREDRYWLRFGAPGRWLAKVVHRLALARR